MGLMFRLSVRVIGDGIRIKVETKVRGYG